MTRKHFDAIAECLRIEYKSLEHETEEQMGFYIAIKAMLPAFKQANPRFDRERFLSACGLL